MFVGLQITISNGTESLWDIINKTRANSGAGDNVYTKLPNFCRYLSLQRIQAGGGANSAILISGTSRLDSVSGAVFTGLRLDSGNPRFVLKDMEKGLIPLQDIFLANVEDGGLNALNVIIITKEAEDK